MVHYCHFWWILLFTLLVYICLQNKVLHINGYILPDKSGIHVTRMTVKDEEKSLLLAAQLLVVFATGDVKGHIFGELCFVTDWNNQGKVFVVVSFLKS